MINIDKMYYLPCWYLYMDLIETRYNPEPINFYDWSSISHHNMFHDLHLLIRNMEDNMSIIIAIVETIVKDITNNTDNYIIRNNEIEITFDLVKCDMCNRVWDGYAQCPCL